MRLGEPGVIVSDLCHKRNIFPPPRAHPAPLLEDLFDCKVVLAELSLFKLSISYIRYFIYIFVLSSQSLLLDQCVRIFSFTIFFTFFFRDF